MWAISTYITHIVHYAMTKANLGWITSNIEVVVLSVHIEATKL